MLDNAFKYEDQIRELMLNTWYDDKYKFYHASTYNEVYRFPSNTNEDWNARHFVSLDSNRRILGLIVYSINRDYDFIDNLTIINFSDNKVTFGRDLAEVIDDIFCKYNFRKLEFTVVIGNPIEKSYDRLVKKYGGNIVGIRHQHCKLIDNQYYDDKIYELFREDYIKAKENK